MVNKMGGRRVSVWRKQTSVSRDSGSVSGRPGDKTALHAQKEVGLWGRGRKRRRRWRSSGRSDFTVVVSLCYIHVDCIELAIAGHTVQYVRMCGSIEKPFPFVKLGHVLLLIQRFLKRFFSFASISIRSKV